MNLRRYETRTSKIFRLYLSIFLWIFILCAFGHHGAENNTRLTFQHLQTGNGLSNNSVQCILRDHKGFMWFGTRDGLNRFDGYNFLIFKPEPGNPTSLSDKDVTALGEDRFGELWVGTFIGGLNRLDRLTNRFTQYRHRPQDADSLGDDSVSTIYEDSRGMLWIGTHGGGLNRFNREKNNFLGYKHRTQDADSLDNDNVNAIYEDRQGNLWVGTDLGLNRLDREKNRFIRFQYPGNGSQNLGIINKMTIYEDRRGILWIGSKLGGLKQFDRVKEQFIACKKFFTSAGSLCGEQVFSIYEDRSGIIWIGTNNGLDRLDPGQAEERFIHYRHRPTEVGSLSNNYVYSIYQDHQGILWVGTWGGGISIWDRQKTKFNHYQADPEDPNSLNNDVVNAVYQDPAGVIWIGTGGGGLTKFDREKERFTHYLARAGDAHSLSGNVVFAICGSRTGALWIGTVGEGLNKFDPKTATFTQYKHDPGQPNSLSNNTIFSIYEDRSGLVWISTWGGGLDRFDPKTGNFTVYRNEAGNPNSLSDNKVTAVVEDSDGIFWIGTMPGGLNRFDRKTGRFTVYKNEAGNPNSLSSDQIISILVDRQGILWIGSWEGGLNRFDKNNNRWRAYTQQDGLPGGFIYGILADNRDFLWLSTDKGISRFNPREGSFKNFEIKDGLQGDEFNPNAFYKNPATGEMFFGGMSGFNSFFPDRIKDNTYIPPVVITAFKKFNQPVVFDKEISEVKEISLREKDSFFSFEFAAMNLRNREKNLYAYKLEGFDKDWVYCGTRRYASYTNLSGGDYVFRVIGSNDDGLWNKDGASVRIKVLPPVWKTGWFRFLLVLAILFAIYTLYRLRFRNMKRQHIKLEKLVAERTAELRRQQADLEKSRQAAEEARVIADKERQAAEAANRFKSNFLAYMSHEIRTPMNAIIGFNEMMMNTQLTKEQLDYVQTVMSSGESLLTVINEILDFSRVESGQLSLESIAFDPEAIAFEVCELIKPRVGKKPVEIICRIGDNLPATVVGDPGRYRQVLTNLMGNAAKFTKTGDIQLIIDVDKETDTSITLHASVKDTGIGIPRDKQATIFEAFHQADRSIAREYGGSGLGLSICKQLARLMAGDIWLESEPGQGSTFHFSAALHKSGEKPVKILQPFSLKGKRVLVVDDNRHNREILARQLTSLEMEVVSLDKGTDVLPTLSAADEQASPFDICILDIHMPDLDGIEVARQIRRLNSASALLPLLAFTSSYSPGARNFKDLGFDGFLSKPVHRDKLIHKLERLLAERGEEQPIAPSQVAEPAKQAVRILLAEDNPVNRKLATYLFINAGHQVKTVNNGAKAVNLYTSAPDDFDIIFMDVQMPDMDGIEATNTIRSRGFKKIPIIAMTAYAMKGDREKCLQAGMNDYISKPIKQEAVFAMIKKWTLKDDENG